MKTIALALALTALLAVPAAFAQETRASAAAQLSREFKASDANRDGTLERSEVEARLGHMKAGKSKLSAAQVKRLAGLWFARADADHNGRVTEAESQALMAGVFNRYDLNKDGRVDGAEAAQARAAARTEAKPKGR